ncbi:ArnT family glycosyltransferase [Edaphobacter sp.]|uniref:ArnT family glycosyltransferase n=1 Tax=Edaphobacter sp. TaxID=1934404 RepID=UPI002DC01425|nr:glycosyltransferase family 39 protein [Edaphobacter sp.]HEU5342051.1 glycosyltransferase family 39 protein [Edaphobacter sp.]
MTTASLITQQVTAPIISAPPARRWSVRSIAMLTAAWFVLQIGGLFTPGLLDDVDSIYIEVAREMLHRHDYVTPYVDGVRFFDKPPLMYWMAAGSMRIFGVHDWAARLPLALAVLALLIAVYALGIRLFHGVSPEEHPDRGGFYAALAVATSIGPYLYTRFYIPDILLALWMTLGVHLFLIALDRVKLEHEFDSVPPFAKNAKDGAPERIARSALAPCLGFAVVMALNVLTKGLIGLVFPLGFVLLYLAMTGQLRLLWRLRPVASAAAFFVIAAPWHVLAAVRNPPIALPGGLGLPVRGGWAWFYLYNEHFARFLGKRIPHDYGLTPVWLFWLYLAIWVMPWAAFVPSAIAEHLKTPRAEYLSGVEDGSQEREASLALVLWAVLVVGFFSVSSRQEYYSLPAIPALALMAGGLLARADSYTRSARSAARRWHVGFLMPVAMLIAAVCAYFAVAAPRAAPGTDISTLLETNPQFYNLSLGHLFDLTGAAMGLFRGPLIAVALGMLVIGPGSYLVRRNGRTFAANLTLASAMMVTLLAAHVGLARFYPALGSKGLALDINHVLRPGDLILIDGELTSGSTLVFYTRQQVHVIDGRVNGLWYGSFWPDAPHVFESESSLRSLWAGPQRIFLMTYHPAEREQELAAYAPVHALASAGGKTVLSNR